MHYIENIKDTDEQIDLFNVRLGEFESIKVVYLVFFKTLLYLEQNNNDIAPTTPNSNTTLHMTSLRLQLQGSCSRAN